MSDLFPRSLRHRVESVFRDAFAKIGAAEDFGTVVPAQKPEFGDLQCNGAMAAAKALGSKPRDIAQAVVEAIGETELVHELAIAGPGFINMRVREEALAGAVGRLGTEDRLGLSRVAAPRRVFLDFGGPNVAKPMHVGHLRSSIIGDSLQRIMRFVGHEVTSDVHLGDWGTQMGMLIEAVRGEHPDHACFREDFEGDTVEPFLTIDDLQRLYPQASAACKEDPGALAAAQRATAELQEGRPGYRALWRHFVDLSLEELHRDFAALGIAFDQWFGESRYHDQIPGMLEELRAAGVAQEDAGALVVHVQREEDRKEVPPLLLVKSDGGYLYATTDLATIRERVHSFHAEELLYVVDKRQGLHFEQVFRAGEKAGYLAPGAAEHLAFGTMNGPDGKPFKTRAGGVMRLAELIATMTSEAARRMEESGIAADYPEEERGEIARRVGLASLKYADLQNPRANDYIFDAERFTRFEGRTGAYLCYAVVRIKSILRNAAEKGFEPGVVLPAAVAEERALHLRLVLLPDAIIDAVETRMPHHLAVYAFELSQAFSAFYTRCHILSEEDAARRASWLGLVRATLRVLEQLLEWLGMEAPERM